MRREFVIGEWAFYWRVLPEEGDSSSVDESAWKGPAVVCSVEPPRDPAMSIMDRCYWLIHGAALLRCTHEQMREETPEERLAREGPAVLRPSPEQTLRDLRERLSHVRGPVRYVDISGKSKPHATGAEAPAPPGDQPPPASAVGFAPPPAPEPPPVTPRVARAAAEGRAQAAAAAAGSAAPTPIEVDAPTTPPTADFDASRPGSAMPEWLRFDDLLEPDPTPAAPSTADLFAPETPQAAVPSSPKREFPSTAVQEIQRQRSAAGEPPLQRPRLEVAEGSVTPPAVNPVMIPVPESDEELWADVYMLEDSPEDVFLVSKGSNAIVMSRLTPNERALFEEAKDKALLKYINRTAWKPFEIDQVRSGTSCPMLYVLKWKFDEKGNRLASARVCLQGFQHEDAVKPGVESKVQLSADWVETCCAC